MQPTNITKAYIHCFTNRTKHPVLPTVNNIETFSLIKKPEKKLLLLRLLINPKRKIKQHHQQKDTKASTGLVPFFPQPFCNRLSSYFFFHAQHV